MLKEIVISVQAFFEAHRFIVKNKLWKWIIVPGIIYCLLFSIGIYFFGITSYHLVQLILLKTGVKAWLESMQDSWLNLLVIVGQGIIMGVLFLFYFSMFKFLFLIIGSPVFAYLSEKTESIIEGRKFPFSFAQLIKDIMRGIRIACRNLLWQSVYLLAILFLACIPVIGWIAPLIAFFTECYYFGFSMLDYSSERNKMPASQSIEFIGKHRGLAIGNGLVFYLMHAVLIVGWVFAPGYAVVAATLSLHKAREKQVII